MSDFSTVIGNVIKSCVLIILSSARIACYFYNVQSLASLCVYNIDL